MTLQAFKAVEFETNALRVTPVTPGKISRFEELPLISYRFTDENTSESVFYNIECLKGSGSYASASQMHAIARRMQESATELGVHLVDGSASYYNAEREFLGQTMQNLIRRGEAADLERSRGDLSGVIRGGKGHTSIPLPKGATLRIFPSVDAQMEMGPHPRWDCILKGDMFWFGKPMPFAVYHAHCQGFEFENLIGFADQCQKATLNWFPWLEGHICFDRIYVETNPVSHQDKESRSRG